MRFLADMGVNLQIVGWLLDQGHDATHLRDEGLHRMPDREIFQKAIAENRVVLTLALDFGEIAAFGRGQKGSVIIFRLHNTRTAHVLDRLVAVLPHCIDALEAGAIVVVEEQRHRIRYLPIGESR